MAADTETPTVSVEGRCEVLLHDIEYWYRDNPGFKIDDFLEDQMREHVAEHAKDMIMNGYRAGALNFETEDQQFSGWWGISR